MIVCKFSEELSDIQEILQERMSGSTDDDDDDSSGKFSDALQIYIRRKLS